MTTEADLDRLVADANAPTVGVALAFLVAVLRDRAWDVAQALCTPAYRRERAEAWVDSTYVPQVDLAGREAVVTVLAEAAVAGQLLGASVDAQVLWARYASDEILTFQNALPPLVESALDVCPATPIALDVEEVRLSILSHTSKANLLVRVDSASRSVCHLTL